ncbi:MAG TPA: LysR family transcriptional regulator [Atopostipes sp.]|nr:LysR family transcriptional regulator [Atopostipes sp.]
MQMEQLKYIVTISTNNSISESAKVLHVSQSALSQSVAKLEEELGVKVFHRSRFGTIPTKEGEIIITLAKDALDKLSDIKNAANQYKNRADQEMKVGLVSGLYLPFLPMIISQLQSEFLKLNFKLIEKGSREIIQAVHEKVIDVGILAVYEDTLKNKANIHLEKLYDERMYVFVNNRSPLTSYRILEPLQLINESFILYNGEFMNWYFEKIVAKYGKAKILFRTNNAETIRESVRKGLGITIETKTELLNNPYIKTKEIIAIPLKVNEPVKYHIGVAMLKETVKSMENKRLIELLRKKTNELMVF